MIETLETLKEPFRSHLLGYYAKISRNPFFKKFNKKGFIKKFGKENLLQSMVSEYIRYSYPDILFHHSPNEGKRGHFARRLANKCRLRTK